MAPSFVIDETPDFNIPAASLATQRTLLLAPPSLSAHPEALSKVLEKHDRSHTDMQMLDRLALGMISLPTSTYDVILLLTDVDGSRTESQKLVGRDVMTKIVDALKSGGTLKSQDGKFGIVPGPEKTEAILAGLILDGKGSNGMMKPSDNEIVEAVPLKLGSRKAVSNGSIGTTQVTTSNGKRKPEADLPTGPAGVGFVDFGDDFDIPIITGEDDELIDEDDLLTEEDMTQGIIQRKDLLFLSISSRR
jgi:hypothetical protein